MMLSRLALGVALSVWPTIAAAECALRTPDEKRRDASAVFLGTALEIETFDSHQLATFLVDRVWKGEVGREQRLYNVHVTAESETVVAGRRYVVFARIFPSASVDYGLPAVANHALLTVACGDLARVTGSSLIEALGTGKELQSEVNFLNLSQAFGRYQFSSCRLHVIFVNPPLAETDRVELSCSFHTKRFEDVVTRRPLSRDEAGVLSKLLIASDFYSGGHIGRFSGNDGPWERLEVRCCGRGETALLVTDNNPSFATGPRSELLNLLHRWREPLLKQLLTPRR
jgi:hypothetical protein